MNLELISWNVNGFTPSNTTKAESFSRLINEWNPDILALQEVKVASEQEFINRANIIEPNALNNYDVYVNSSRGYSGVTTMVRVANEVTNVTLSMRVDESFYRYNNNRVNFTTFHDHNLVIVNVYIPNSGTDLVRLNFKSQWMVEFTDLIKATLSRGYHIIVLGDVNVVPYREDIKNYDGNHNVTPGCTDIETRLYEEFFNETGLIDVAKSLGRSSEYSYFSQRFGGSAKRNNTGWRLDHFWISPEINIIDYQVFKFIDGSDHCPIYLKCSVNG